MLKNYIQMVYRHARRDRVYSFINIAGLAIGMTCCLFIFLFVQDELRYDRYHERADQIYRLRVERYASGGESELSAAASAPMLPALLKDHAQVEAGTRFHQVTVLVEVALVGLEIVLGLEEQVMQIQEVEEVVQEVEMVGLVEVAL